MIFHFPKPEIPGKFKTIYKILKSKGILGELKPRLSFPDEPQFFHFACQRLSYTRRIRKAWGYGCSENISEAVIIAIAEAIEYYSLLYEQDNLFIRGSYNQLKKSAIDPLSFVPFSEDQLKSGKYNRFRINHDTKINWLRGFSLLQKREVLVPASVVYGRYSSSAYSEPVIQLKNSTGGAVGLDLDFALYRGICEIIERDAYMINFANSLPMQIIDVANHKELSEFKKRIERYNFEVYWLSTKLDFSPLSVISIILDRSGSGAAVSAGLGCGFEIVRAIKTATFEAVRRHIAATDRFFRMKPLPMNQKNSLDWFLLKKQQVWAAPNMLKIAESFIMQSKLPLSRFIIKNKFKDDKSKVEFLLKEFKQKGYDVIYVDVTIPEAKKLGLTVVKVLIPEMVPLWRDERYPYLGYKRLTQLPDQFGYHTNIQVAQNTLSIHPF